MNDAKHRHDTIGLGVPGDHDVWGNNADANVRPQIGARRAGGGKVGQMVLQPFKGGGGAGGDEIPCLGFKISLRPLVGEAPEVVLLVGVVVRAAVQFDRIML